MSKITSAITAVGAYVPEFVLSNKILEEMVETNDEWITSRTGIKERRILKGDKLGTSYLAIKAAQDLIRKSGINPKEIDLVIVATTTPDMPVAATAVFVATQIGATDAFAYYATADELDGVLHGLVRVVHEGVHGARPDVDREDPLVAHPPMLRRHAVCFVVLH